MVSFPPAKINLGLRITEKRKDGFHNLETIFISTGLCDVLEIIPRIDNQVLFSQSGIILDINQEENLCVKAYRKMMEQFSVEGANIYLHKNIPSGAGLGGGSSDAAYVIMITNSLYNLNLHEEQMIEIAATLGNDCPYFILNQPAYACEKGNKLRKIDISLQGLKIMIVKPQFGISTPEAYRKIQPAKPDTDLRQLVKFHVKEWKSIIYNDFEKALFPVYPELSQIKEKMYANGAIYVSMSGSGSAFFGLFENIPEVFWPDDYFVWKEN